MQPHAFIARARIERSIPTEAGICRWWLHPAPAPNRVNADKQAHGTDIEKSLRLPERSGRTSGPDNTVAASAPDHRQAAASTETAEIELKAAV